MKKEAWINLKHLNQLDAISTYKIIDNETGGLKSQSLAGQCGNKLMPVCTHYPGRKTKDSIRLHKFAYIYKC